MTELEFKKLKDRYVSISFDGKSDIDDYTMLIDDLFLALENALLKLGNRSTQIKDLKHRGIYDGLALALKIVKHYGEAWEDAQKSIESHLDNLNK